MRDVTAVGRLFILLTNWFRKTKIELIQRPMYMILNERWYNEETFVYLNDENLTEAEIEDMGLHPSGRKWLIQTK